jgi:hypothetical protein
MRVYHRRVSPNRSTNRPNSHTDSLDQLARPKAPLECYFERILFGFECLAAVLRIGCWCQLGSPNRPLLPS